MNDKELMQQALDAMLNFPSDILDEMFESIRSLRARLAQPEPEPVAVVQQEALGLGQVLWLKPASSIPDGAKLYPAPPPREFIRLTDEEMFALWVRCPAETEDRFAFARAIEQALKEKNNG